MTYMNRPSDHQEKNFITHQEYFYQCYALAHCTLQMYITELPSLVFTEQLFWRLVHWNVIESQRRGSVQHGQHASQTRNKLIMFETDAVLR